jgi:hypothetical protein
MSGYHQALGIVLIGVNALAAAAGGWAWWRRHPVPTFWPLLRAGQVLVIIEAVIGAGLLLQGQDLPRLHLIYGLVPIAVSFVGEQLRLASADTVLQQHDLDSAREVAGLPEPEQRALVAAIIRRETGVMAASAAVVTLLALRAQGWL